jgi:ferredoxin
MIDGDPFLEENADAILVEIDGGFLAKEISDRGAKLLERYPDAEDESHFEEMAERSREEIRGNLSKRGLPSSVDLDVEKLWSLSESEIWEDTREGCIGCAVCSFLCPTCHCFDISDGRNKSGGERVRVWDTCAFDVFTEQASGHNPRPTQRERMRQRIMHKFCYIPENFCILGCVGCGRCIRYCPGGNDVSHVLANLS